MKTYIREITVRFTFRDEVKANSVEEAEKMEIPQETFPDTWTNLKIQKPIAIEDGSNPDK